MQSSDIARLVERCRDEIALGRAGDAALQLMDYAAAHPQHAPLMRQLGQAAHASGNPALAVALYRAALTALKKERQAQRPLEAAESLEAEDDSDALDEAALQYIDDQHIEIERHRSDFEFAEDRSRSKATWEAAYEVGTARQTTPLEDDASPVGENNEEEEPEEPYQPTLFDALLEGTDVLETDAFEDDTLELDRDEPVAPWELDGIAQLGLPAGPPDETTWEALSTDAYDYDEAPTRAELVEIEVEGAVSRQQRALQEAIQLGLEYGWDGRGVRLLAEIFETYFWSSTKRSLRTAIQAGCTQEELALAHEARLLWRRSPHFGLNLIGYTHEFLSWPLAVELVRAFRHLPDISEIELFLDNAYDDWRSTAHLLHSYPAFRDYVKARLSSPFTPLLCSPAVELDSDIPTTDFDRDSAVFAGRNNPLWMKLQDYGLLPRSDDNAMVKRVGIVEWHRDIAK